MHIAADPSEVVAGEEEQQLGHSEGRWVVVRELGPERQRQPAAVGKSRGLELAAGDRMVAAPRYTDLMISR